MTEILPSLIIQFQISCKWNQYEYSVAPEV